MSDFLLELRTEEIPARMQAGARRDLEKAFREHMAATGVTHGAVTVWSTPRRLALIARGLPDATEAVREEIKGPKVGAPPQALEGFLRKVGQPQDKLEDRGGTYFAIVERPGRATREVLAWAIAAIVRTFPWPKAMRWGAASVSTESPRWVRPLSGIVAILGEELVECTAAGVASGYATLGHRFHAPGPITIGGANDYQEKLRACHVIVDHAEREALIRDKANAAAAQAGLALVEDEGLVIENAGLTEWPVPLLGRFDAAFLEVPPEVIQLTARTNQKYFVCTTKSSPSGGGGPPQAVEGALSVTSPNGAAPPPPEGEDRKLANAFVCTANIDAADGGAAIVDGNRKVLAARLSDARFFWEQDRKKTLAQHAEKLANIVFHEKLGTVADKVERVAKLARWLVEEGIVGGSSPSTTTNPRHPGESRDPASFSEVADTPDAAKKSGTPAFAGATKEQLADMAEQAARLCKADLVTEMVGEFPELQGLMGGYYARAEGLPDEVADAIRDHYKPVGQGDEVPTAPVTVAVSLADKLDTLVVFFAIGERPTGSKDPFALRRAAIAIINLIRTNNIRIPLQGWISIVRSIYLRNAPSNWLYVSADEFEQNFSKVLAFDRDDVAKMAEELVVLPGFEEEKVDIENLVHLSDIKKFSNRFYIDSLDGVVRKSMDYLHDRLEEVCRREDYSSGVVRALIAKNVTKVRLDLSGLSGMPDISEMVLRHANLSTDDDLVRLLARVHALQAFVGTPDGANLLAGYKRAANILKKESYAGAGENLLSYTPEPAERSLIEALDAAEPKAREAVAAEEFGAAMGALASLRGPIDAFFEAVTVNDEDPAKRAARLSLLARFRGAVHQVADFSKIEG